MRTLSNIPIKVEYGTRKTRSTDHVLAILHELTVMLESLTTERKTNSIDLRRSPLDPADFDTLDKVLGQGAVSIELNSMGLTRIRETVMPGLWRVTHCNQDDEVVGEFIEVTECPEIIKAHSDDIRSGLGLLQLRLTQYQRAADSMAIVKGLEALGLTNREEAE